MITVALRTMAGPVKRAMMTASRMNPARGNGGSPCGARYREALEKKELGCMFAKFCSKKKKKKKDGQVKKSCFSPAAPWMFNVSAATEIRCPQV